jgi:hypothetical protein
MRSKKEMTMTTNRQFSAALEALSELKAEIASPPLPQPIPAAPTLNRVLSEIGSLPREALFLGIASDGLPVLLNLHDPIPGPVLVTGDPGAGKTALLQMVARSIPPTHSAADVQYAVVTAHPEEWRDVPVTDHCVGIFSVYETGAQDIVLSLASWAHGNKSKQAVVLLVDDLESIAKMDAEALNNFRWLLLRGPARRVWSIVTMNAERYGHALAWIPMFRTRLFGRIEKRQIAEAVGGDEASALDRLEAGIQFALRENGGWLRFWVPGS